MNMTIDAGYYWMAHKTEQQYRIVYIGLDCGDNLWVHNVDSIPIEVSKMDLSYFTFIKVPFPHEINTIIQGEIK